MRAQLTRARPFRAERDPERSRAHQLLCGSEHAARTYGRSAGIGAERPGLPRLAPLELDRPEAGPTGSWRGGLRKRALLRAGFAKLKLSRGSCPLPHGQRCAQIKSSAQGYSITSSARSRIEVGRATFKARAVPRPPSSLGRARARDPGNPNGRHP